MQFFKTPAGYVALSATRGWEWAHERWSQHAPGIRFIPADGTDRSFLDLPTVAQAQIRYILHQDGYNTPTIDKMVLTPDEIIKAEMYRRTP